MPTFAGTLDALEPIRDFVGGAAQRAGMSSEATYKLCLAVDEVATNIVLHGYEEAGLSGSIAVDANVDDGTLCVRLTDTSPAYDPDLHEVTEADIAAPLHMREPGGLGLFLVRDSVDDFRYERIGDLNIHDFLVKVP